MTEELDLTCEQEAALRDAMTQARAGKEYELADKIREALRAAGYIVQNTPRGIKLRKKVRCYENPSA
jgi:cysteinyl-tRNA synthetase